MKKWYNIRMKKTQSKAVFNVENELDAIKTSSLLVGYTLSKECIQRCKLVLEGKLDPEDY